MTDRSQSSPWPEEPECRIGPIRAAIIADCKGARNVAGRIPCPIEGCGGTVRYEVQHNGHVWAACSNAATGCTSWIE